MTWYVVEGMDGSGKSTVADLVAKRLSDEGRKVLVMTHPDSASFTGRLASNFLHKEGKLAVITSTVFYILNILRSLSIKRRAKKRYDDIIFVRYDLAAAYMPEKIMQFTYDVIVAVLDVPDVRIFVDIDPDIAMKRILDRGEELEVFETAEKLAKTRRKMLALAGNWIVINNSFGMEQTVESVNWVMSEIKK